MFGIGDFAGTRSSEAPRSHRLPDTWRSPVENFEIVMLQWFWHRRQVLSSVSTVSPSSSSTESNDDGLA